MNDNIKFYTEYEKIMIDKKIGELSAEQASKFSSYYELQKKDLMIGIILIYILGYFASGSIYYGKDMPKITWILVIVGWLTTYLFVGFLILTIAYILQFVYAKKANDKFNYDLKQQYLDSLNRGSQTSSQTTNENQSASTEETKVDEEKPSPWNYE